MCEYGSQYVVYNSRIMLCAFRSLSYASIFLWPDFRDVHSSQIQIFNFEDW